MEIINNNLDLVEVFTPYITKKGKRVYKKDGGLFHFWAKPNVKQPEQTSFLQDNPDDAK